MGITSETRKVGPVFNRTSQDHYPYSPTGKDTPILPHGRREHARGRPGIFCGRDEIAQGRDEIVRGRDGLAPGRNRSAHARNNMDNPF